MRIRLRRKKKSPAPPDPLLQLRQEFPDVTGSVLEVVSDVAPYTMTSPARLVSLCDAVEHITQNQVPGDIVECGVWRGGSMMAVARSLVRLKDSSRTLWLYDTFDGMSEPDEDDVDLTGNAARHLLDEQSMEDPLSIWCRSPFDEVRRNLESTGYGLDNMRFVAGMVEETIPASLPERISLLRLDTDWYESTLHELTHLYPRLSPGGVLIIDDYGHWQGCRRAVDEYFASQGVSIFLHRIDYTGRLAIKPPGPHEVVSSELKVAG